MFEYHEMKRAIILNNGGGRLADQLWNFISVYAYALVRGYACEDWAGFEYYGYF